MRTIDAVRYRIPYKISELINKDMEEDRIYFNNLDDMEGLLSDIDNIDDDNSLYILFEKLDMTIQDFECRDIDSPLDYPELDFATAIAWACAANWF